MKRNLFLCGLALALMVVGCEGKASSIELTNDRVMATNAVIKEMAMATSAAHALEPTRAPQAPTEVAQAFGAGDDVSNTDEPSVERLIIYNANLSLVVRDTQAALDEITALVNELGGFVVSSHTSRYGGDKVWVNVTVRVPSASLEAALAQWRDMAVEVRSQSITGQDVTAEYADSSARLRHLQATEERLLTFLDQAEDTESTLAVYAELRQVQGEIEQVKGRVQYMEQASALSLVSIELAPDELAGPLEVGGWKPQGALRQAAEALVDTLQLLLEMLIWALVYVLPLGVVVLGPPGVVVWVVRRRRGRRG